MYHGCKPVHVRCNIIPSKSICDRIIHHKFEGDERAEVVAYGNASFVTRGRFPGPVKAIRREVAKRVGIGTGHGGGVRSVEFREVTEDYTSKLCSKVDSQAL